MTPGKLTLWCWFGWGLLGVLVSWRREWLPWWLGVGAVLGGLLLLDALAFRLAGKLELSRRVPERFALGVPGEVRLELVNRTRWPLRVELFDGVPEGAECPSMPWRGVIPAGERARIEHEVRLLERGLAKFRPVALRVGSPLGLWRRAVSRGGEEEVKVYPDYEPVVRFALLAMEARQEQMGIVRRSLAGNSRDFHQLREYREGDPLATIDWKASARRGILISREFEEQRNQTILFLTDTGRRMRAIDGDLPQFDHALNAMLLVSYVALRQGDRVGVLSFGGTRRWLPPVKGAHSMSTVLNHLFDYRTTAEPSDFAEAAERLQVYQRRRAMVVLMTNLRGEDEAELVPALRMLSRRHLVVLASLRERSIERARREPIHRFGEALRFAAAERYDAERREVMATLRAEGVITLDVPAEELPVALANRYLDIKAMGRL